MTDQPAVWPATSGSSSSPVTWLLPVLRGMPFLPATLASIEAQSYRNQRIIAWDNGSDDGSLEELKRWIPSRIPGLIVAGRPLGLGGSLGAMVEMADTELCARIDSDDVNEPERLASQVAFLEAHPGVGVVGCNSRFVDENDAPVQGWDFQTDDASIRWTARWVCPVMHPAVLFRRQTILEAGNYRDCQPCEDMELWIRVAAIGEMANLPARLLRYRRTKTSQTGRVTDFRDIFRQGARMNAAALFPDVAADEAMALWEASYPHEGMARVTLRHIRQLDDAATALAMRLGKPADYFRATAYFSEQKYHMRRRWMQNHGLGFARDVRHAFRRAASVQ